MSSERDDDDTDVTESDAASATEPSDTKRHGRSDTLPDARVEAQALLDRLLPADGRAQPPRAIAKQGASSGGGAFAAYSGEGRPAKASQIAEPVEAVVVMAEVAEGATAAGTDDAVTEPARPRALPESLGKTQTMSRKRSRRWLLVLAGVVAGLVALFLALRG